MADSPIYRVRAKNILRAELKRKGLNYRRLAELLETVGIEENERNIANKISRGTFTAAFFLQCLDVAGVRSIGIDE
ncbi:MAG: DUF6471 domain-containing protein [bacterium]